MTAWQCFGVILRTFGLILLLGGVYYLFTAAYTAIVSEFASAFRAGNIRSLRSCILFCVVVFPARRSGPRGLLLSAAF